MEMVGRTYVVGAAYNYSINGQEKTPEIAPNTTTALFWEYDARISRRWNIDPIVKVWESPYACFSNDPITLSDPDGADAWDRAKKKAEKRLAELNSNNKNGYVYSYTIENNNAGNVAVRYSVQDPNNPNNVVVLNGQNFVEKRSWLGRKLNQGKQFAVGMGEGFIQTAEFAINIFNPDPDKNSVVQTVKFAYNVVTDPVGTYKKIKKAIEETDWNDPKTWGNIFSNVVTPGSIIKVSNKVNVIAKVTNRANALMKYSKNFILNPNWKKWGSYMNKRGWTYDEIEKVLTSGEWKPHSGSGNFLNSGNSMSIVTDLQTGKSLIIDNVTKEIIQLSSPSFKF